MSYLVLARKWRPKNFADVVGQQATLQVLQNSLCANKLHHAYLFTGSRGIGKTTLARIFAKCMICEAKVTDNACGKCEFCVSVDAGNCVDIVEIDAASKTKVEDTRELLDNLAYAPVSARFKIYIIDEVHMLSNHSFNALLKSLEEPPAHVKFLLATTEPQKIPATILSRCLSLQLKMFSVEQIVQYLQEVLTIEKVQAQENALRRLAVASCGSMRDALSLLERTIAFATTDITLEMVCDILGTVHQEVLVRLLQAVIQGHPQQVMQYVKEIIYAGYDCLQVMYDIQDLLHKITVLQVTSEAKWLETTFNVENLQELANNATCDDIQLYYQIAMKGIKDLPYAANMQLGFEMTMLRMIAFNPVMVHTAPIAPKEQVIHNDIPKKDIPKKPAAKQAKPATPVGEVNWSSLLAKLQLTGLTKELAEHCVIDSWQDDKLVLQLDPSRKPLLTKRNEQHLTKALVKHLQKEVRLTVKITETNQQTPRGLSDEKRQADLQAAKQQLDNDQNVQELLAMFDADITNVKLDK